MSDSPFELKGFEPISRLGGGGFGEVWLARQVNIDREVAIKIGHAPIDDKTVQLRFERECIALGRLSGHPNIIDVFTAGQLDDGRPYLVLEFVNGGTLWQRLQRSPLSEAELCRVGIQLSDALAVAHTAGVLHRDLKPENVLLRQNGDTVLGDFGIARLHDGANTTSHAITASVAYAAPEILSGKSASVASDLYGIGICLLASALRSVPFVNKTDESIHPIINRVLTDKPPDLRQHGVSAELSSVVGSLLEKDPNKRPRSATDAKALIEAASQAAQSTGPMGAAATVIAPTPPPHATQSGQRPGPTTGSHAPPPSVQSGPVTPANPAQTAPPPAAPPPQNLPSPPRAYPAPTGFPAPSASPGAPQPPTQQAAQGRPSPPAGYRPPSSPPPSSSPPPPHGAGGHQPPPQSFTGQQGGAPYQQSQPYGSAGRPPTFTPPTFAPPTPTGGSNDRVRVFALAFGATVVVGGLLLFVLTRLSGGDEGSTPDITTVAGDESAESVTSTVPPSTTAAPTSAPSTTQPPTTELGPLVLPLTIADTSLPSDATITPDDQGPDSPQFCDNIPVTVGLDEWDGETLADPIGSPLIFQEVSRFDSAAQAQAYLASYVATVNCSDWILPGEAGDPDITIAPEVRTPAFTYGDETHEIWFEGTTDFATIVARTALVRDGRQVFQISVTSLLEGDLDELDPLLELSIERLQS